MANDTEIEKSNYIDWLEKSISEEHIIYYEYSDFRNLQPIGSGSYGNVVRANWKNDRLYALKSFKNDKITLKEVNEVKVIDICKFYYLNKKSLINIFLRIVLQLKLHRIVTNHENIIQFYGITKKKRGKY